MSHPPEPDIRPLDYHELSKHRLNAYAPGPATLDWAAQPSPFRHFPGAPKISLPLSADRIRIPFTALASGGVIPATRNGESIGALLELALGISAWKSNGVQRWAVRCNPSSGNLHPVECYLVLPATDLGPAGLYHYDALDHALALRCAFDQTLSDTLFAGLPGDCVLAGLSLVPWREAWKYGVRAWRYCQLDLGHAIGALGYAAGCLGWRMREQVGWSTAELTALLGLDRKEEFQVDEPEVAAALLMLGAGPALLPAPPDLLAALPRQHWHGSASRLDPDHRYRWDAVDAMARGALPCRPQPPPEVSSAPQPEPADSDLPVIDVIRQRRSTRAFDPHLAIPSDSFYRLLDSCRPRPGRAPWDRRQAAHGLHLLLFVHRVDGLPPGLYLLAEHEGMVPDLRAQTRAELTWDPAPGCPGDLPCYRLIAANAQEAAMHLGCHQEICADSAFALAMLGDVATAIDRDPGGYDRLLREAGRIGQVLYIEARAEGIGASGIGCFFDDPIRQLIGPDDLPLQPLYMFTVGAGRPELGLIDEPPYPDRPES